MKFGAPPPPPGTPGRSGSCAAAPGASASSAASQAANETRLTPPQRTRARNLPAPGRARDGCSRRLGENGDGFRGDRLDLAGRALELLVGQDGSALEGELAV